MKNDKMLDTKTIFNSKYFKVGEAVKIIDHNKDETLDGLILEIDGNILIIGTVEWNSPMCGSSQYEQSKRNIWVKDIQESKVEIIKYNNSEEDLITAKSIINEVKNSIKEYEIELEDLDKVLNDLEIKIKNIEEISKEYRQNLQKEIDLLNRKNNLLKKGTALYDSSIKTLLNYSESEDK